MATLESMGVQEVDDTLAHYIVVLVKNRHTGRQLNTDLTTFLGENTVKFTHWLCDLLMKAEVGDVDEDDFAAFAEKDSALKDSKKYASTGQSDSKAISTQGQTYPNAHSRLEDSTHAAANRTVSSASLFSSLRRQSALSKVGSRVLTAVLSTGAGAAFPSAKRPAADDDSTAHKRPHVDTDSATGGNAFSSHFSSKANGNTYSSTNAAATRGEMNPEEAMALRRTEQQLNEGRKGAGSASCPFFPSCKHGDKCKRVHPKPTCRFDDKCTNDSCPFNHTTDFAEGGGGGAYHNSASSQYIARSDRSSQEPFGNSTSSVSVSSAPKRMCRFGTRCRHDNCPFEHTVDSGGGVKSGALEGNRGPSTGPASAGYDRGYGSSRGRDSGGYESGFKSGTNRYGDSLGSGSMVSLSDRVGGRGVCRFDGRCRKPNCPFQHLQDNTKTRSVGGFGGQSQYANTQQASPSRSSYSGSVGGGGNGPNSYASEGGRGGGFGQRERPPCRFQDRCTKPNCPFTHDSSSSRGAIGSDIRGSRNSRPRAECKFGSRCTKAQCSFYHSEKDHISDRVLVLEEADS
ncbi:hypothetical protein SARC_08724 [Sphaeroforma arctica JP610]|uniref:C3H1-type domain-containing protein n=1 Tax=Sphaeroforma arctica JP610 TaxID=667725 RepID=A0A0L0FQN9_9EUKA|nr:hypothetical protein SARC_08724 [Sphaeroforma arctica JP610]KNC78861.1 hypothetical protein SARC_08724 [Sphaeroforma arctica JP610]|eukprot:XP_014152763.1 hypothetical protein SARC_08724 [Sphaeroforma arctica JP610]